MSVLAPPPSPPTVAADDNDGLRRVRMRLFQVLLSAFTVFITVWFCTLGPIPGIVAVLVGKHVLVAIFLMGLGMGDVRGRPR